MLNSHFSNVKIKVIFTIFLTDYRRKNVTSKGELWKEKKKKKRFQIV